MDDPTQARALKALVYAQRKVDEALRARDAALMAAINLGVPSRHLQAAIQMKPATYWRKLRAMKKAGVEPPQAPTVNPRKIVPPEHNLRQRAEP